ncbi:unnamed protein product [Clonostachys rosea f. rosea IK726]|uniref:GDS1 winged helix domain-containing protein n=2 Tax=Bionectria ochroleuca TaxID=29856 RepID=A0A0B7JSY7_BIOOC|nr:unnamed protein product [Clonostachys rosea f. rosea IK726]
MPYNTRRKSLSLPSLGIHIPVTNAARAAAASKSAGRPSSASASTSRPSSSSRSQSPDSHASKRIKRSHASSDSAIIETTPPPSPTLATSVESANEDAAPPKIDLESINDDIVEATISQLQQTANRPHLVKDLATVLAQRLSSVQNSANPCAIISSRLASYMKRSCWSALTPCPLAKELETVHPRRTYYFLTTFPRQALPESGSLPGIDMPAVVTPSVSLTDDTGSDDVDARRRQLSPSPEIDLPPPDFDEAHDDKLPATPSSSIPKYYTRHLGELPHDLPPLEKDEREFTQTANTLQKRKFGGEPTLLDFSERSLNMDYGHRDDVWFGDNLQTAFLTSPAMKPVHNRKDDEAENWLKLNKIFEWDQCAESIEIDELDGLWEGC